jgi:uncharacterized protein YndB with AHSA1/START domain
MPSPAAQGADTALTITRLLDATPERVWKAWTDPDEVSRWMGPGNWTGKFSVIGLHPGAEYRMEMRHTDGDVAIAVGRLREVVPSARLVYSWAWLGEDGKPGHETLVTLTLCAVGAKTELTLRHEGFEDREARDNHYEGWDGALDKLVEFLAGKR